ncbi:MAG: ProQ/FINO family protein [Candidatus Competibacteraceae bacterium]
MRAAFPAASSRKAAQPLKSGLGEERLALASVHSALADLRRTRRRRALKVHTSALAHRKALARATPRQRLDGQPAGEVTLEQRADAKSSTRNRPCPRQRAMSK